MFEEKVMMSVYGGLLAQITGGGGACLRTRYTSRGIERELCKEEDNTGWQLERNEDGTPAVLTEFFSARPRFIILGGGHIALPLTLFAAQVGFSVVVYDDRPEFASKARFSMAAGVICDRFENMAERLSIRADDYIAIVTRGHRYDTLCLRTILQGEMPHYLGMIGSRRKVAAMRSNLLEEGAPIALLERLHAPIGLAIGAATPEEIAVSIVAELIAERRLPAGEQQRLAADCDFETIRWLAENPHTPAAMATVVSVKGSAPRGVGAKMVVLPHGELIGSIGGGCAEADIRRTALDVIATGGYRLCTVDLTGTAEEDGMVCGGVMQVLLEDVHVSTPQ